MTNAAVTIHGGASAQALSVNLANDLANLTLEGGSANDALVGGGGNDFFEGRRGADAIAGGGGIDTVELSLLRASVGINLATGLGSGGDAAGDTLTGIENVLGSDQDDILTGNGGSMPCPGLPAPTRFTVEAATMSSTVERATIARRRRRQRHDVRRGRQRQLLRGQQHRRS